MDNNSINNEWITFADLMTILSIIFVILMASYSITKYKTTQEVQTLQSEIYIALMKEFKDDLNNWSANIDEDATVSFTGANLVQFDQGKDIIKDKFKNIISDFFPRYVAIIKRFDTDIRRVRIEGHTSSEWNAYDNEDIKYFNNLDLSQKRAFNVLEYSFSTLNYYAHKEWIKTKLGSEGLSSSDLILDEFKIEDKKKSRRTVFKVQINHGNYLIMKPNESIYSKLESVR